MSSNIEVKRICQYCNKEFTAKTTVTKYCSKKCNSAYYKSNDRNKKIEKSNIETIQLKNQSNELIKAKEFLTVREVAQLLNCSVRSAYYYIDNGTINAVNLGQRLTRVKRSEIDNLFNKATNKKESHLVIYHIKECYTLKETQEKFGVSEKALFDIINRNKIPKIKKGRYAYVPKKLINELLA